MAHISQATSKAGALLALSVGMLPMLGGNAAAHHAMGGKLPDTATSGFLSGLGHPIIGFDHFAFIVAVGIACAFLASRYALAALFVGSTLAGCLLVTAAGIELPMREIVVAASVLVIGAAVMSGACLDTRVAGALFVVAGLFHGAAYAQSIVGAEATPLVAYLAGFSVVQYGIIAAVILTVRNLMKITSAVDVNPRLAGALVAGIGATFLIENIESLVFAGL